jgi:hypothetical protein
VHERFRHAQTNFSHAGMKKFHFRKARIGPIIRASGGFEPGRPPDACRAAHGIEIR